MDGFAQQRVSGAGAELAVAVGGKGPPLLLVHGYPQTKEMWGKIAPRLAEHFTLVIPDLRGYGQSEKPRGGGDHATYSKRAMAADLAQVMTALGHETFAVAAHDRGARAAHRLALDHAGRVTRLTLMDIIPTFDVFERTDQRLARFYFHWFFLAQPEPLPEGLIGANPDLWTSTLLGAGRGHLDHYAPEALATYMAAFRDPAVIHATTEDYRAGATIDLDHDRADRAQGVKIACPLQILWGAKGVLPLLYDVLALWQAQALLPVTGQGIPAGHFLAEQAPEETLAAVLGFHRA